MKKLILLIFLIVSKQTLFAQSMGINTLTPDSSAALDIQSDHQGLLIPRVSLKTLTDSQTITSPAHSLLIYNRNSNLPGGTGYYYNAGTKEAPEWKSLSTTKQKEVAFRAVGLVPGQSIKIGTSERIQFGSEEYDLSGNYDDAASPHGSVFTAPVNGIYHFDVTVFCTPGNTGRTYLMRRQNGVSNILGKKILAPQSMSMDVQLMTNDEVYVVVEQTIGYQIINPDTQFGQSNFNGRLVIKQ